jgi:hypothetical protein
MEILGGGLMIGGENDITKKTFLSHVFCTTEEGKAEVFNVLQYVLMALVPVVILNKSIQRFIPEADPDKSSLELLVEIFIQLVVIFAGIIIIHRVITYIPTYSGFKYENLTLTNVILGFLIIVLSIQSKLGIKVNILVDRINELWNGSSGNKKENVKQGVRVSQPVSRHAPSQADYLDNNMVQQGAFPPAPVATTRQNSVMESYDHMMPGRGGGGNDFGMMSMGPMAANGVLGGSFGSAF